METKNTTAQQTATATLDFTPRQKYDLGLITFREYLDTLPPQERLSELQEAIQFENNMLRQQINDLINKHTQNLTLLLS